MIKLPFRTDYLSVFLVVCRFSSHRCNLHCVVSPVRDSAECLEGVINQVSTQFQGVKCFVSSLCSKGTDDHIIKWK